MSTLYIMRPTSFLRKVVVPSSVIGTFPKRDSCNVTLFVAKYSQEEDFVSRSPVERMQPNRGDLRDRCPFVSTLALHTSPDAFSSGKRERLYLPALPLKR